LRDRATERRWAGRGALSKWYDVLGVWRPWTTDLRGHAIESGHHMAEENPEDLAAALGEFFGGIQR